ncbi:hypothetical protein FSP39_007556 [Pinctada imbricata]|uniref:M-phase inducer phosphatase n=1 Tax=Pinctada imbricata TaxID=66713 RepID=A0AA88XTU0_PINIB|nr:hypothetical protein FSP39_007556 [Pinctada imbricata]
MDDAMDIDDAMIAEVLTPTKNKAFCPMQIDEDSGLGMDFEQDTPLPVQKEAEVISAVHRLTETDDVTGDGSRTCCLPTIIGKHNDLKNISNDTVVDLINGKYNDVIESYQLIDCRYPYEYEAGHVTGALNIFKDEKIPEILSSRRQETDNSKRHILIFYCEFSSERGPKMCRKLRTADRELNCQNYPHLNFPEIYVMHNGYKAFYHSHEEYCTPQDYKPMLHKDHAADLRHFRSKSKSWSAGERRRSGASKLLF